MGCILAESISTLEIKPHGLGSCLSGNFISVPKYQRAYSWDVENVKEFLFDINTAFLSTQPEYFMGSVVVQGRDQQFEVVDGQQRLTTAAILIAAIRDYLNTKGQEKIADSLAEKFLMTKDIWNQEVKSKLQLSVYDDAFFLGRVLKHDDVKSSRESHDRIASAFDEATSFVERFAGQVQNWVEHLKGLVEYLEHRARIILVIVPSEANAFVIFETLNDRGKDLSASDLLKNYLFGRAGARVEDVQAKWNMMLGLLEVHGGDDVVITYIRHFWSATRELAREKELFAKIRERVVTEQNATEFATELHKFAAFYAAMLNEGDIFWKNLGPEAEGIIKALNIMKLERFRPTLLALMDKFQGPELVKAMRLLLNGAVRYLIVTGSGGGFIEGVYSDVARKIFSGQVTKPAQLAAALQQISPLDEEFRSAFQQLRSSKAFLARYFLGSLERHALGKENSELIPNGDQSQVNLEHVLPENPEGNWADISPEVAGAFSRRLGNMALLSVPKNQLAGNLSYVEKRPIIAASQFLLTKSIAESASWGPDEINARQQKLADLAVAVWAFKA